MVKPKKIIPSKLVDGDDIAMSFEKNPNAWIEVSQEEQDVLRKRLKPSRERRISIRVSIDVLNKIQEMADTEGLPYQTLINSHLHKWVTSRSDLEDLKKTVKKIEKDLKELKKKRA